MTAFAVVSLSCLLLCLVWMPFPPAAFFCLLSPCVTAPFCGFLFRASFGCALCHLLTAHCPLSSFWYLCSACRFSPCSLVRFQFFPWASRVGAFWRFVLRWGALPRLLCACTSSLSFLLSYLYLSWFWFFCLAHGQAPLSSPSPFSLFLGVVGSCPGAQFASSSSGLCGWFCCSFPFRFRRSWSAAAVRLWFAGSASSPMCGGCCSFFAP